MGTHYAAPKAKGASGFIAYKNEKPKETLAPVLLNLSWTRLAKRGRQLCPSRRRHDRVRTSKVRRTCVRLTGDRMPERRVKG